MNVLAITILISLLLSITFLFCFVMEAKRPRKRSLEQDSLIPFQDSSDSHLDSENTPSKKP